MRAILPLAIAALAVPALVPAASASCAAPPAGTMADLDGTFYLKRGSDMGVPYVDLWYESNGHEGLQTSEHYCESGEAVARDTFLARLVGTSQGPDLTL